ncbi:MAG: DUF1631 domain-containing protein [Gammaproteobacteria bacterium]|nr:DUF1631 domain-containing protein [Gammaproteobacteria bacterium]MBU1489106.1 DUF1631 domain-containing protein [Gammaproteobacteria bacterium]MBU2066074.1 DUF1631 domain-containing protein [Gammaproteobacteria bacterium]MBU2139966.1 DUF1631 domain-containing protein [Gammaproteobacteria bacterium]MBU2218555.1 DUF1631 domain-containing protein [Gammaproteobacteria bacterium]
MKTDANVVHLTKVASEHPPTSPVGRLPVALIQVRDKAAVQLKQALQALFDNADDTLFEMADRATSNAEQNAFFEAMRDLRLKRKSIERGFLQNVFEAFATLNQYEIGRPAPLDAVSYDSLSLVQNDELEESVAQDAMVAKVMSRDSLSLGHLTTRLNAMVSKKLDDKSNPLGPAALVGFFLQACSSLGVEIRVKLIILKLFEKYVLGDVGQLYADANQALVQAGVLPELKSTPPRRANVRAPAGRSPGETASVQETFDGELGDEGVREVFGALQALLSQARGSVVPQRDVPADAMPITSNDLMRLLSHMQQRAPVQVSDDFDLREQLEQLLSRASAKSGKARVVGEVDEDVINLVSMLFEFILDDRTLPDSLKALIGRLQIPMLKVAVLDKTFFSRGSHPARRLLNEIASAALGWGDQDEAQRDSLYLKIEQVVQRLLNDFVDDPTIFSELLADFLAFTGDERRRSELLEQRTRDAEEGSARAELARREVEHALNERLLGRTLPEVVVRLLQDAWSKVLMLSCLKHGVNSPEWEAALATMDDLVWSVEPHEDPQSRMRLLELVPGLLKSLREGMASAAFDPFSTGEFFNQLEVLHVQAFQRFKRVVPEAEKAPANDEQIATDADELSLPLLELPPTEEELDMPAMVEVVEEIVLIAPGESRSPEPETVLPDDDEAVVQVDNLRVGSWVEFQEDEEHKLRCKLAAIIKPTGKYIFVNRTGMKVLEKTRMGLAVEFRRNAIRLLDDALLFDRALESVIGNLRRIKGA